MRSKLELNELLVTLPVLLQQAITSNRAQRVGHFNLPMLAHLQLLLSH